MREIRHEVKDEAVLPNVGETGVDAFKSSVPMETPILTPKDKLNKASPSIESDYREDIEDG